MHAAVLEVCEVRTFPDERVDAFIHPVEGVIAIMRRGRFPEIEAPDAHVALFDPGFAAVDFVFTGRAPLEPGGGGLSGGAAGQAGSQGSQEVQSGGGKQTPADGKDANKEPVVTWVDPLTASYMRHFPAADTSGGTPLNDDMKVRLALTLADYTFLGEFAEAAKNAVTDPKFIITTILTIGIYVGLWLAPDATLTKIAAGVLTAAMLLLFTWNDLWGFCVAWDGIYDDCRTAGTEDRLRVAGDKFLAKVGQVGFDVFLMLLFWGLEKGAGAKVRAGVKARATARANAHVSDVAAQPGTGVDVKATGDRAQLVPRVAQQVGSTATPAQFLDGLATELDAINADKARAGLDRFREAQRAAAGKQAVKDASGADPAKLGDEATRKAIEARQKAGSDIVRWLEERSMTREERAAAKEQLAEAQADAALKRIMQLRDDPALATPAKRAGWIRNITVLAEALLGRSARFREAVKTANRNELVGILGEMLARAELRSRVAGLDGVEVRPSLEVARRVPGVKTVAEWLNAQRGAWEQGGKAGPEPTARDAGKLRTRGDEVWESLGQADNVVVDNRNGGKGRLDTIEETKTGSEAPGDARAQVERFRNELTAIGDGSSSARVFEKTGPQELGRDCTDDLDLNTASTARLQTTGTKGRTGFGSQLPVDRPALEGAAQTLIDKGVPREDVAFTPPPQRTPDRDSGEP
jgi:hypothetical protein